MYLNRETGTCSGISVRSRLETNSDDRPLDRVREAESRRRLDRLRRRKASRRPAASVTAPGQQRHVRQEEAATRLGHSRRRYVQDVRPTTSHFSVALSTRLDDTRQRDSSSGSATSTFVTLRRTHTPTSTSTTTVVTFVHHGTAQRTRAQFQIHCVSVIHINRLTGLLRRTFTRRSLKYINSMTAFSQLSTHTDASATSPRWHGNLRVPYSHKIICHGRSTIRPVSTS